MDDSNWILMIILFHTILFFPNIFLRKSVNYRMEGMGNLLLKNSVVGWERLSLVEFSAKLLLV